VTASEKMRSLALSRLQQAEESLDEAQFLFDGGKSLRSVINRVYYAMFYAILALLIFEPFGSSKHTAVLSYFNLHFIKNGRLPKELGRAVNKAFELRQRGDYKEIVTIVPEQAEPLLSQAAEFIRAVRQFLVNSNHI
jgi:uncharacterized protein (UPF0332 family)